MAEWRERKRERGRGRGNGNPSFGGQGSHAPLLIKIINNVRMEGSPLGPQLATYNWISFPARAPVLISLLACSSVFRVHRRSQRHPRNSARGWHHFQSARSRREGPWNWSLEGPGARGQGGRGHVWGQGRVTGAGTQAAREALGVAAQPQAPPPRPPLPRPRPPPAGRPGARFGW